MVFYYVNKYNIMLVRLNLKWDFWRLCKIVGVIVFFRLIFFVFEEMGYCDSVCFLEVGDI